MYDTFANSGIVTILPKKLLFCHEYLDKVAGIIEPMFLYPWVSSTTHIDDPLMSAFVNVITYYVTDEYVIGTVAGRVITDPCDIGKWHSDTGNGLRFVTTIHEDSRVQCGHEFFHIHMPLESGLIAMYKNAIHRRPAVQGGKRVLLSAAFYKRTEDVDLSCVLLEKLRK